MLHHHKDRTLAGFTHHHCKFHPDIMRCLCMCHNEELDQQFAYKPNNRFFWKRTVENRMVDVGSSCGAGQKYSPLGADTPSRELTLCRDYSLGNTVVAADGGAFVPGAQAQGSDIVIFKNDRISWMGADCTADGTNMQMKEVEVFTCVNDVCPHPTLAMCSAPA